MKNVKLNIRKLGRQGFSLIEMLVVIAVIGVIAAIAIPNIGNINDSARTAAAQRNAQSCSSVYASAIAAGYTPTTQPTTAAAAVELLRAGVSPTSGTFKDKVFQVPNLPASSSTEYTLVTDHLEIVGSGADTNLAYKQ
jgi:type IV pilus assembly protein PilA